MVRWLEIPFGTVRSCLGTHHEWSRPGSGGKEKWRILPVGRSARPAGRPGRRPPEEHAMAKGIKPVGAHELEPVSLSELIHQHVRAAIEVAVHEELRAALGTSPYERIDDRPALSAANA